MTEFVIQRRTAVHAGLALGGALVAAGIGYWAYSRGPTPLWLLAGLFALLALVHLVAAQDSVTPLLVADDQGVRMRIGKDWFGILWNDIGDVRIEPRDGLIRDAHVKVVSVDGERVYTTPVGAATNVSATRAQVELAARRKAPAL